MRGWKKEEKRQKQAAKDVEDGRDWLNQKNRWKISEKERGEGREICSRRKGKEGMLCIQVDR
jgi:hypothetical protein